MRYCCTGDFSFSPRIRFCDTVARNVKERMKNNTFFQKLREGCSERIGTYEISTNRFESHGGTCRNVSGTCGNVMKLIVKTTYSLLTEYPRRQSKCGCRGQCRDNSSERDAMTFVRRAWLYSYLTRLLALVRGSALERNGKHLAPNVPKNPPSKNDGCRGT